MSVLVRNRSRLRFASLLTADGVEFWDLLIPPSIPEQTDDILYTVKTGDRIDLLAFQHYGDSILWAVIALANKMEILPTELEVGSVIRIPSPTFVSQRLFGKVK